MEEITTAEVRTGAAYEAVRRATHDRLAAGQALRRIDLGDELAVVFDSRATLHAALEEGLRTERRSDDDAVAEARAAVNRMRPRDDELIGVLYLVIADAAALADRAAELRGLAASLSLDVAGRRSHALTEPGEDLSAGACAVRFGLDEEQRRLWLDGAEVSLVVEHPSLRLQTRLSAEQRAAVGADLTQ